MNIIHEVDLDNDAMEEAMQQADAARDAEAALLRNLAVDGELSSRRDALRGELQALEQHLVAVRQKRESLVKSIKALGGKLPTLKLED